MAVTLGELIAGATRRLASANDVANELKHQPGLHRLAMETVFVLEDTLVMLRGVEDSIEGALSLDLLSPPG